MAYVSVNELKTYLDSAGHGGLVGSTDEDTLLTALIAAAQSFIEGQEGAGRVFEAGSNTTRYFTVGEDTEGRELLFFEDLCQITSVVNGDGTTVTAAQYVTLPRNQTPWYGLRLLSSAGISWTYNNDPEGALAITGRWAYSITPPEDIKHACKRLAAWLYRQKDSGMDSDRPLWVADGITMMPAAIPRDVMMIITPYRSTV